MRAEGRHGIDAPTRQRLQQWLQEQPDLTLAELAERLDRTRRIKVSLSRCCRVLKEMGLPRKKRRSTRDSERVSQARVLYRQDIATLALERFRFVDESGINLAMTRRYGRASRGLRVLDAVPKNHGKNVTVLGALSCQGIDAVMTVEGATGSAVFRAYVWQVLAPTLAPGDIVVMDNLGAHKVKGVRETTGHNSFDEEAGTVTCNRQGDGHSIVMRAH